jgi:hypothetical protein
MSRHGCFSAAEGGHALDKTEHRRPHPAVLDGSPGFSERTKFLAVKTVGEEERREVAVGPGFCRDEVRERNIEVCREPDQAVNRNAVGSAFVFLKLLKSDGEISGGFKLSLPGGHTGEADGAPQIPVERAFGHALAFSGHEEAFGGFRSVSSAI